MSQEPVQHQNKIDIKDVTPKTNRGENGKVYVRKSQGRFQKMRRYGGWFLMLLFAAIPWIDYQGRQAILLDLGHQQFNFFSTTLYPQDLTLLATLFIVAAFALFFITTFLGRVWCGYLCPQTVWTFIFIWFEEKLEGAANKRRKQDQNKYTSDLIWRKTLKHIAWWAVSILTGLTFVGYFIDIQELFVNFFSLNISFWPAFWVLFFAACTYGNAGWMRSIMCLHMCPYARFQSAMFDKDTFIVGYNEARGEQRGPRSRKTDHKAKGLGDCIDCELCVQVCPTGIDIRDGLQYECINCGACIDACDATMDRMGYPRGLISYTTEHKLQGKHTKIARPKLIGYGLVMLVMLGVFFLQIQSVEPAGLSVIRDRAQLSRTDNQGWTENTYLLKVMNKTQSPQTYQLKTKGLEGVKWHGRQQVTVAPGEVYNLPISLAVDPDNIEETLTKFDFVLEDNQGFTLEVESRFIGSM